MNAQTTILSPTQKRLLLLVIASIFLALLGYKSYDDGWFLPRVPLNLDDQPAVIFFNRHKGCACAVVVYDAAAHQIATWPEAQRYGVRLIQIDLDCRPDLGTQFGITRAPTLVLIDHAGEIIYQQHETVTDLAPLDLLALEVVLREMTDGN